MNFDFNFSNSWVKFGLKIGVIVFWSLFDQIELRDREFRRPVCENDST